MTINRHISIDTSACKPLLIFLIFFITGLGFIQEVAADNETSEKWDRLLIEEIPLLKENIEGIINAIDKSNYTMVREQIDDIESAGNWFNVRKELESRNQVDLISSFNDSLSRLDQLATTNNSASIEQAQILSKDFNKIEQVLGQPVIDFQRLLLVIFIIGSLIALGLHAIPKVRKRLNIKF